MMLEAPRYLLGVAELALLVGCAAFGATRVRGRWLPTLSGAPALLVTAVLALALLLWIAELLGSFGLFEALPYLLCNAAAAVGLGLLLPGRSSVDASAVAADPGEKNRGVAFDAATLIALVIAAAAAIHFLAAVRLRLGTGMTGFDSTWYHAPFAAGFFQSANTFDLHFIAPQFLAWFYPANAEIFHAVGMAAFDRDILSPLLNFGWFIGCLACLWCIGRPFGVAPWSLALGAVALSVPVLADQAGEARNDIVGIFFLLAAIAIALDALPAPQREGASGRHPARGALSLPALAVIGLAAGMAAGTKLNFLLPCAVLVLGLALAAPPGSRWRSSLALGLSALAGGGYWYLRNLLQTGNPLPWFGELGPISLPAPEQALGGREAHSVLGYLTDGSIWSAWFLPGLHQGLWLAWPLLSAAALAGLLLCLGRRAGPLLRAIGLTGLAVALAWLIAPTSASGPDGIPRGFESGLRYLAPALVLGLALLPVALREQLSTGREGRHRLTGGGHSSNGRILKVPPSLGRHMSGRGVSPAGLAATLVLAAIAIGYPIQRHYLKHRYADPSFAAPGLNAAFGWARDVSDARIATTSTRQYPLFGTDLSNRVQYIGVERPHGGFVAPASCPTWRRALNGGDYDYLVASRDRIEPGKPPYPRQARWAERGGATAILRKPPTIVFKLNGPLSPSACGE
jgi:hypothetical protein